MWIFILKCNLTQNQQTNLYLKERFSLNNMVISSNRNRILGNNDAPIYIRGPNDNEVDKDEDVDKTVVDHNKDSIHKLVVYCSDSIQVGKPI